MERLTRKYKRFLAYLGQGTVGYLAVNLVLMAAEAKWHLLYRLTVWDMSEMKLVAILLAQTAHH
ncbi:MAG TPA: hypothetical protein VHX17_14415 [Candidatus Cybelea sp.]|jgi:hypothetical protein|nr:hypothetical protein [Candidatus Cybelea sp.]